MELVLGGLAAVAAGLFSNPLDVVKIRMQLQGELKASGKYDVHYRNVFHAAYTIGAKDGILALQKGLVPALCYQFIMNGSRLGIYQLGNKNGLTKTKDGKVAPIGSIITASVAGGLGALLGSPFFLVKTQLQSRANDKTIAVGQQHQYVRMGQALRDIYGKFGILGFWRGCSSSLPRVMIASSVQLPTFDKSIQFIRQKKWFPEESWLNAFGASMIAGIFVSFFMAPFDLISTRFYNQGVNTEGKGILYKNIFHVGLKVYSTEGLLGFFKGWTANYFRLGPHTLLCLVFWDQLKYYYQNYENITK